MKGHSLRKAINEKCKECIYDPANGGNWRQQVSMCTCFGCSLWPIRPLSTQLTPEQWAEKAAKSVGLTAPELN